LVLPRVRPNGLILFDNMLDDGKVAAEPIEDARARSIDAMNKKLVNDPRVETVLLSIADGIQLCRKR
jgi:caffeoyl-CoA O-methyltransferase